MIKINEYIKKHRLEVYNSIKNKCVIYLDTKYWLIIRDQIEETDPRNRLLLDKMIELSESGKCIFPISEISFWEFSKQDDFESLKKTANIVDKLSKGISMINVDERKVLEFRHFLYEKLGKETFELNNLVWTKLSFILGYEWLSNLESAQLQEDFFNLLIKDSYSLTEIIQLIYPNRKIKKPSRHKDNTESLNKAKEQHSHENKSFKEMFLSELAGFLDLSKNVFKEVIYQEYCKEKGIDFDLKEFESIESDNSYVNLIINGFKTEKLTTELPYFRIIPELFASARWNKYRKFKDGNDTPDFLHASYALPYCDYFFTEKELRTMIGQRKLDKLYNCQVESNENRVLEKLKEI